MQKPWSGSTLADLGNSEEVLQQDRWLGREGWVGASPQGRDGEGIQGLGGHGEGLAFPLKDRKSV